MLARRRRWLLLGLASLAVSASSCKCGKKPPPPELLRAPEPAAKAPAPPQPVVGNPDQVDFAPPAERPAVDLGMPLFEPANTARVARLAWEGLGRARPACGETGADDWSQLGPRTAGCALLSLVPYTALRHLSGVPVFLSGPHGVDRLDLDAPARFGHYNPAFVAWAVEALVPGTQDPDTRSATQESYARWLQPLARTMFLVHEELERDEARFAFERQEFDAALKRAADGGPGPSAEVLDGFMSRSPLHANPEVEAHFARFPGFDGRALAFWLRRDADGTRKAFAKGAEKLLSRLDPDFLQAVRAKSPAVGGGGSSWSDGQVRRYVEAAWRALATSGPGGDPTEEGSRPVTRMFGAHAPLLTGALAGLPVFLSGQRDGVELDSSQRHDFGRYNPAFVKWLVERAIPYFSSDAERQAAVEVYRRHLQTTARTYLVALRQLERAPGGIAGPLKDFTSKLEAQALAERWYLALPVPVEAPVLARAKAAGFQPPARLYQEAVAFWLRRSVDGTRADFAAGLDTLVETFDPDFRAALRAEPPDAGTP